MLHLNFTRREDEEVRLEVNGEIKYLVVHNGNNYSLMAPTSDPHNYKEIDSFDDYGEAIDAMFELMGVSRSGPAVTA